MYVELLHCASSAKNLSIKSLALYCILNFDFHTFEAHYRSNRYRAYRIGRKFLHHESLDSKSRTLTHHTRTHVSINADFVHTHATGHATHPHMLCVLLWTFAMRHCAIAAAASLRCPCRPAHHTTISSTTTACKIHVYWALVRLQYDCVLLSGDRCKCLAYNVRLH